ncbi:MAG TPA: TonB-dependent receptor, partial [Longimicrobium sp.]|nr:TonB-dependent receptor [Longimicrobium sp.]
DVHVRVDARAAEGVRSHAVSGVFTAPEALRRMLEGTGLAVRFADASTALVTVGGEDAVYALTPVTAVGQRGRAYASTRTTTATRTDTPLRDAPQAVTVVTRGLIADQSMQSMADVVRYVPGITMGLGEGHRDAPTIRGNASTADFFVDGVRDDAQYLRDLYNVERVEALKGSNAMIFGRGGGGGVLNRVTKEAQWSPVRAFTAEGGSYDHRRTTLDVGQGVGERVAARFNGVYEKSETFRDNSALRRYGINPSVAFALGRETTLRASYELFDDHRTVDRGIPSFEGRPSPTPITTFFGNPDVNVSQVRAHSAGALLEHVTGWGLTVRNRTRWADYDKFYQNTFPGVVSADRQTVALSAYNQTLGRRNLFNQTDLVFTRETGGVKHTLLLGGEIGRQETDSRRETGYYNDAATSFSVPFASPTVGTPVTFRQSATDADSRTKANVAAVYLQEQATLSRYVQAVAGVRWERFELDFFNRRNQQSLDRTDELLSPRAGLVLKPVEPVSIYGAYSVSYLPGSGDQFGSLTATSETLEPERFTNREVGAKWDVRPGLQLTAAVYRLDRTNTSAPDPDDATKVVQTGEQRTTGWELGGSGNVTQAWQVV